MPTSPLTEALIVTLEDLHVTQLGGHRSNSGVRCKPSSYSSAACGSFITRRRLPSSGVALCTLLILRGASGGPGLLVPPALPKSKAMRTDVPVMISPAPLLWPSRPRETYFNEAKAIRHETDGGLNNATRDRRSCSDS